MVRLTREAAGFGAERFKLGALYSLTVKTVPQLIMGLKLRRSELNIDLVLGSNVDLLYKLKNMELDAILIALDDSVSDPDCEQLALFSDDPREREEFARRRKFHVGAEFTRVLEAIREHQVVAEGPRHFQFNILPKCCTKLSHTL